MINKKRTIIYFSILVLFSLSVRAASYDVIVAPDGSGNYKTIQEAINAAPSGRTTPFKIFIRSGIYNEQVIIPANKPFLELVGENVGKTIIAYGDGKGGTTAFTVNSSICTFYNLTFENTQGRIADGPQSLAIRTRGDCISFYNCRFISGQDTVLIDGAGKRVYFNTCYIDGNTDFIYGPAIGVFDNCLIYARDRVDGSRGGYITAASTPSGQKFGLVFRNCIIPDNHGVTHYTLGRPWQNDQSTEEKGRKRAENKVVFLNTKMGASILPEGWSMWDKGTVTDVTTYAEYRTRKMNGSPLDMSRRVAWSKQLTEKQAQEYYQNKNLFAYWDPIREKDNSIETDIVPAITNLIARTDNNRPVLQFNSSWPVPGVTYTMYKGKNKTADLKPVAKLTAKTDTEIAFEFRDTSAENAGTCFYKITASKANKQLAADTLTVNWPTVHHINSK